jgi:hypothetical protein
MRLPAAVKAQAPEWIYVSGSYVICNGEQRVTLPSEATIIKIQAEGGPVYYSLNTTIANTTSPGYIAQNTGDIVGPLANLTALTVYGAGATVYAHIQFFREG